MFIDIDKIITEYEKDKEGHVIKDPTTGNPIFKGFKIARETIRLDEIKSARSWHKSNAQEKSIDGDVCALYMLDIDRNKDRVGIKTKPSEIHIAESHESFSKRMNTIKIGREEKA